MTVSWKRWLLHISLFLVTFVTATMSGGPLYAIAIMSILLAHELGHYRTCKRYGVTATFPIFIPMPNILGTMGAVIAMKSPIPNRRALFDIGVAGPFMGLALAIPAVVVGLFFSKVAPAPQVGLFFGEPLLFKLLSHWILGPIPQGYDTLLHPIAFAGWAALFVTSINLFPVGQLDGGHMMCALLGRRAKYVSWMTMGILAYLGIRYHAIWFVFMVILFLLWRHPAPIDDVTPLDRKRVLLGCLAYALLIVCFVPIPFDYRL